MIRNYWVGSSPKGPIQVGATGCIIELFEIKVIGGILIINLELGKFLLNVTLPVVIGYQLSDQTPVNFNVG